MKMVILKCLLSFSELLQVFLPQEFVVKQTIKVIHEEKDYVIWRGVKRDPSENAEARGKYLVVTCDLTSDETLIMINNGPIFTRCIWDVEADKEKDIF